MSHEPPLFSFIIPVRNQSRDLTLFLFELYRYFESRPETFEVIVVDDGSRDQTPYVVEHLTHQFKNMRLFAGSEARGLGGAARLGLLEARGHFSVLIRPGHSLEILDELLNNLSISERGIVFGSVPLRSSLWPPALLLLTLWRAFDWCLARMVSGGASCRLSPIIFPREVGREVAALGRIAHAGYQFELVFLAERKKVPIRMHTTTQSFSVFSFPLFYFLTVLKEMIKIRFLRISKVS